jgi:hypothetical protein
VIILFLAFDLYGAIYKPDSTNYGAIGGVVELLAIYLYCSHKAASQKLKLKEFFKTFSRWKLLGTLVVEGLLLTMLFILLIIPGLIFIVYWLFAPFIVIDQNIGYFKAFSASKQLVKGNWWRILSLQIIPVLLTLIPGFVLLGVFTLIVALFPIAFTVDGALTNSVNIVITALASVIDSIGMIYGVNVLIATYLSLKTNTHKAPQVN